MFARAHRSIVRREQACLIGGTSLPKGKPSRHSGIELTEPAAGRIGDSIVGRPAPPGEQAFTFEHDGVP
jgi:hypothetical protein